MLVLLIGLVNLVKMQKNILYFQQESQDADLSLHIG